MTPNVTSRLAVSSFSQKKSEEPDPEHADMDHDQQSPAPTELNEELAAAWREHRPYLLDLAFRMLGSINDAEDIVQEAFIRLLHVESDEIDDLRGWLIVVVSRLCLDQLRSARSRREEVADSLDTESWIESPDQLPDPADRVTLDDSVRMALLVVLERLTPAERAAFVLHDIFQFSFETVGSIVGRSPTACRQLASRARRHVQSEAGPPRFDVDLAVQRRVAEGFIAACASGDLENLMAILDPDVVGDVDLGAPGVEESHRLEGNRRVGRGILGRFGPASGISLVSQVVNGEAGVLGFKGRQLVGILVLRQHDGPIDHIHAIADPRKLALVTAQFASSRQ
jgi:RNA polymerase sigma-70 factor (ECF subfamily)